jgi:heme exporter protein B
MKSSSLTDMHENAQLSSLKTHDLSAEIRQALAIFQKDIRSEMRNRAAVNSILLFSVTSLIIAGFSVGANNNLTADINAAILWIILFFSAFSGMSHVFVREEETLTITALRLTAKANAVFIGKLFFNLTLMGLISLILIPLYIALLNVHIPLPGVFALSLFLGLLGLGISATLTAAIIAKSQRKGALYGAIGFPLLIPLLFLAVDATRLALLSYSNMDIIRRDLIGLSSFDIMVAFASVFLFPYIWES